MGYTHYWAKSQPSSRDVWAPFQTVAKMIVQDQKKHGVALVYEWDHGAKPITDAEQVRFNGNGPEGHETFQISRAATPHFDFCKTAQKPYDTAVVACLICAAVLLPGFSWSSDGDVDELQPGLDLARKVLGMPSLELNTRQDEAA